MTKNMNRVPRKAWRDWSPAARIVFNRVYDFVLHNPIFVLHPRTEKPPPAQWKTVAWNTAWIAADSCDDTLPTEIVDLEGEREVRRRKVA